MKRILFLMFISLAACAPHKHQVSVDPAAKPQFDSFVAEATTQGAPVTIDDLIIRFDDLGGTLSNGTFTGAICNRQDNKTPEIVINRNEVLGKVMFSQSSATSQQELVWHEMGHCVLGRAHLQATFSAPNQWGMIPDSIMYPVLMSDLILNTFADHYSGELFHPTVNNAKSEARSQMVPDSPSRVFVN